MSNHSPTDLDSAPILPQEQDQLSIARRRRALRLKNAASGAPGETRTSDADISRGGFRENRPFQDRSELPGSNFRGSSASSPEGGQTAERTAHAEAVSRSGLPEGLATALELRQTLPVLGWGASLARPGGAGDVATALSTLHHRLIPLDSELLDHHSAALLKDCEAPVSALYPALARLEPHAILALTPDPHLRQFLTAFGPAWREVHAYSQEFPVAHQLLLCLGGQLESPETLLLTPRDLHSAAWTRPLLWQVAAGEAARRPLLVMGVAPEDSATRQLLCSLRLGASSEFAGWFICNTISSSLQAAWQACGFEVVMLETSAWISALHQLQPTASRGQELPRLRTRSSSRAPYKRLHYFERYESDIFFGALFKSAFHSVVIRERDF